MAKREIILTFDTEGNSEIETRGFIGRACMKASEFIERALGRKTAERKTPEFYARAETRQQNRLGN